MAQADELARLRDEVRGSAEREAMEIVTTARRDIRQIVMEARRELFVLSAQVQAALGEAPPGPPQLGPPDVAHDHNPGMSVEDLSALAQEEWGFASPSTVAAVLDEVRADMAVLDRDARAVPSRISPPEDEPKRAPVHVHAAAASSPAPDPPAHVRATPPFESGVAAADGYSSRRVFIAVLAFAAVTVVFGSLWMLRGRDAGRAATPSAPDAAVISVPAPAPAAGGGSLPEAAPTSVSLAILAVRPAWIRAVVDGRPDAGQTLRAGETYEVNGRTIALRVGDAGAVLVSVNGGEAAALGGDGQVVNREYTLDPSPQPSSPEPAPPFQAPQAGPPAADAPEVLPLQATPASVLSPDVAPALVAGTIGGGPEVPATPALERASSPASTPESVLVAAAQRWLDAYHRQDQAMLAALSAPALVVADERPAGERIPSAAGTITRRLDRVSVTVEADTAVLTGVMTERAVDGGLERSAPISLLWISSAGTWRLSQARLVSQSLLGQTFR